MRPEKINFELIESLCEDIAQGFSYEKAALNNGIAASTFFKWMQLGRKPDAEEIYSHLVKRVAEASDFSEAEALQLIRSAATLGRNWKATAWYLEKRFPEKYGRRINSKIINDEQSSDDVE
jgi:transposase-like protein